MTSTKQDKNIHDAVIFRTAYELLLEQRAGIQYQKKQRQRRQDAIAKKNKRRSR